MKVKGAWKKVDVATIVLLLVFVAQLAFLFYICLFHTRDLVDYDSSGAYVHIREVLRQKSLFPSTYLPATTMDVDSTVGLAAILYGLTGRIFLSQGLCNIFIVLCYTFVIFEICKRLKANLFTTLLICIMFFIPYSRGMLGYWSMLFVNVAPNTVRDLTPIFYMSVLLDLHDKDYSVKTKIKLVIALGLILITTISTGIYVFAFGLLALMAMDFILTVFSGDIKNFLSSVWGFHLAACISFVTGMIIQKHLGFVSAAADRTLISTSEAPNNFMRWFMGIFELFGGVAGANVSAFEPIGLEVLCKCVLTWFYLGSVVFFICSWIKEKEVPKHVSYGLMVCLVDGFVLNVLVTTYGAGTFEFRYHIIPMFFVMIMAGTLAGRVGEITNHLLKNVLLSGGIALLVAAIGFSEVGVMREINENHDSELLFEVNRILVDNQISTAVVYGEGSVIRGRQLRAFADHTNIIVANDEWNVAPTVWGGVTYALDNADQSGRCALITNVADFEKIPEYYMSEAEPYSTVGDLGIFFYEESPFDFERALNGKKKLIDFPYSGYTLGNAKLQENGDALSDGTFGYPISGLNYQGVDGTWTYTLKYVIEKESPGNKGNSSFEVISNGEIWTK
ncbi:MAG: hypothetical protein K6G07_08675 [Lachnospiraceae bacterium]|nr:hypothetical protein [Lachnospiraceae bacterium]